MVHGVLSSTKISLLSNFKLFWCMTCFIKDGPHQLVVVWSTNVDLHATFGHSLFVITANAFKVGH